MLIPKCCKTCANKNKGFCCCTLPYTCNEYVEDNEVFDDIPIRYSTHHIMHSEFSELENKIRLSERKLVCDEIRKKIIESTCYETEEEVRNCIYDLNASEVLEILNQTQGEK